jgi:AmiR/NasT family two-component response regulator
MTVARILIVEDERIIAKDLERRLQRLGYTVVGLAVTGAEAIRSCSDLRPDVVLMDIRLVGETGGIEAAQSIRAAVPVPIIYLTAYIDDATICQATAVSHWGYIHKPFHERELQATIEQALSRGASDDSA